MSTGEGRGTRPVLIPSTGRPSPGEGNRRARPLALMAVAAVVALAALVAQTARSDAPAGPDPVPDQCERRAATMTRPWSFDSARFAASPASPFRERPLWKPPYPEADAAAQQAKAAGDPARAARLASLAGQPRAVWIADSGNSPSAQVNRTLRAAAAEGRVPVLVAYAIPLRDCGGASEGGSASGEAYSQWLRAFVAGLRSGGASAGAGVAVILEPDALGQLDRLPQERQEERLALLRAATQWLSAVPGVAVYLDAGHSAWVEPRLMVDRLSAAGVAAARGFSLNVANFRRTEDEVAYGQQMSPQLGGKSFVVDTGRNGNGPAPSAEWCNPPGRALGQRPRTAPETSVDAYLWLKPPGESDGSCRPGQPPAGRFWPEYADELVRNANG